MIPGDLVEFWSGEGRWKPAIVDEVYTSAGGKTYRSRAVHVRLQTGPKVFIRRVVEKRGRILVNVRTAVLDSTPENAEPCAR